MGIVHVVLVINVSISFLEDIIPQHQEVFHKSQSPGFARQMADTKNEIFPLHTCSIQKNNIFSKGDKISFIMTKPWPQILIFA